MSAHPSKAARGSRLLRYARAAWLAVTLLAVGLSVAGIPGRYTELFNYRTQFYPPVGDLYIVTWEILFAAIFFSAAFIIVRLKPDDWVALLLGCALTSLGATEPGMTDALIKAHPVWHWPIFLLRALAMACSLLLLFVFPNGRFVPRWTRFIAAGWTVFILLCLLVPTTPTNPLEGKVWRATPLLSYISLLLWFGCGIYAQVYRYRHVSGWVERQQIKWTMLGMTAAVIGAFWYYGLTLIRGLGDKTIPFYVMLKTPIWVILMSCGPVCIGVAIARYRLWNVDIIINRTLVYSGLSVVIAGVHVITVLGLSALLNSTSNIGVSLPATALAAVLVLPLRDRLQRGVNRLMYGERDDPAAVITRLGQQLETALPPDAVLSIIVETLAKALRLPYAAIALPKTRNQEPRTENRKSLEPENQEPQNQDLIPNSDEPLSFQPHPLPPAPRAERGWRGSGGGEVEQKHAPKRGMRTGSRQLAIDDGPLTIDASFEIVASYSSPSPRHRVTLSSCHRVSLSYQGEAVGHLIVAPRVPGEAFTPLDLRLLDTVARQAGVAVQAARLTSELQQSREQLRTALEEERRRIRRDLHDGLGPALASQPFTIDTIRMLVTRDPSAAQAMLDDLKAQSRAAYADLRRLVYALRPPALDDLGLVGALHEYLAQHRDVPALITLDAPAALPPLSAAVEVAAYRIVVEAVTNVLRHAGAHSCVVRLVLDEQPQRQGGKPQRALVVEVEDDGAGLPAGYRAGVGLASMRERATELGGTFQVSTDAAGGTRVAVRLPLPVEE